LANCGGVIVSYLEWLQNVRNEHWTEAKVNQELEKMIIKAFDKVWDKYFGKQLSLKQAAYEVAMERLIQKNLT